MNGNIKILICVFILHVLRGDCGVVEIEPDIEDYDGDVDEVQFRHGNKTKEVQERDGQVQSTLYQTVHKYYCSLDSIIEGSHLMVYGSKGWTFPMQNVNLTLKYPLVDNLVTPSFENDEEYVITGFKVTLHIDGPESRGYIIDGGVLQDSIALMFESHEITTLRYQFWLYGVRNESRITELNGYYRICTNKH